MLKTSRLLHRLASVATLAIAASLAPAARAAAIVWGSPTTLGGDTDVITTGTLVSAYNLGVDGGATTVNGVVFQNMQNPDYGSPSWSFGSGAGAVSLAGTSLLSGNPFEVGLSPYSLLSSDYRALLGSALWNDNSISTEVTVTLGGLTAGETYYIQFWTNDPRSYGVNRDTTFTATASTVLEQNTGTGYGGLGQWVLGTFTADSSTQVIFASGTGSGSHATMINALQLRSASAIPEPATTATFAGGLVLGAALLWRRRRRAA